MNQRWNRRVRVNIVPPFVFLERLPVPEQDCRSTTLGDPVIRTNVEEESAGGFGPLKSLLEAISIVYANRQVSIRLSPRNPALANYPVGILRCQEKSRMAPLSCGLSERTFWDTPKLCG